MFVSYVVLIAFILKIVDSEILLDFGRKIDNVNPKTDDGCGEITALDSTFDFYGANYSEFSVCNNGFISFSGLNNKYRELFIFPVEYDTL